MARVRINRPASPEANTNPNKEVVVTKAKSPKPKKVSETVVVAERVRQFQGLDEQVDSMYRVLLEAKAKDPTSLSHLERTALALTLIPPEGSVEWKPLIEKYNALCIVPEMKASLKSGGGPDGFNMRNQLFNAEHKPKNPIQVLRGAKYMNMKAHSSDGVLHGKLQGFTLLPATFKMLQKESELVRELHKKFFRR